MVLLLILSLICGIERAGKCETPAQMQPRAVPKGKASFYDAQLWLWEEISVQGWGGEVQNPLMAAGWGSVGPSLLGW